MAILHGSWVLHPDHCLPISTSQVAEEPQEGVFWVWGETWRPLPPIAPDPAAALSSETAPSATEGGPGSEPPLAGDLHPFAMTAEELRGFLQTHTQAQRLHWPVEDFPLEAPPPTGRSRQGNTKSAKTLPPSPRWQPFTLTLPTYIQPPRYIPQHSAAVNLSPLHPQGEQIGSEASLPETRGSTVQLHPWQVQGVYLTAVEAIVFLQSLPLSSVQDDESSWLGADLRFWSHVARWHLDLLARAKFLPTLERQGEERGVAKWRVLLDSAVDQARLEQFARQMPGVCRTYGCMPRSLTPSAEDTPLEEAPEAARFLLPPALLLSFLNTVTHTQVRSTLTSHPLPTAPLPKDIPLREWLQALGHNPRVAVEGTKLDRLEAALTQWMAPLQSQLSYHQAAFRTCFYLQPPAPSQSDWRLEYFLQAANDPDFLVNARVVWNNPVEQLDYRGRTIDQPQETLLAGLGLASRLYPVIEPSLQVQQPQACVLNPLQVYEFIRATAWRLQDSGFGVVLPPSLSQQEGWANRLGLQVQAEAPKVGKNQRLGLQSLLNFKWELTIGGQRLSKAEFDRLVALNTPLVEINGEWVELRPQDVKAAQAFFASRKDQMSLSLEDALRISTGDTQMVEKLPVVGFEASGALQDLINTLTSGNQSVNPIGVPDRFQGELRPYQLRGASWLAFLEQWGLGACLADDMGLGKTVQLLTLMLHLQEQEALDRPTLLVCPTSVLGNWEREIKRFAPSLKAIVHHGDKRSQGKAFAKAVQSQDLVITSYALVQRDAKDLQSVSWRGVVLDEAQNIKNPDAKQSQAVRQLDTQFRIALTGTPVENRLAELWSIMDFLNPGYLGPRNFFQRRFAIPIERYGDTASLQTLRALVQPFILRRLKTDRSIIQDLPDKQEMTIFCGLTEEQATLYQALVEQSLTDIESAEGIQRRGMILALLTQLKQVCNHPVLFKGQETVSSAASAKDLSLHSGKVQRLEAMLDEVLSEGDRSLVFTQFAAWGKLLQAHLEQRFQRQVLFLYGSTSKKHREEMVDRFQNDPQAPRIFILSLKAGGVGLNLTRANHVFHFDRWWNPAVENQATDRVFRIGQTRNVQVHKFVCTGTLEERIHELIESKKALSEQVVGAGENWLTELDTDALRNLLLLDRTAILDDAG